MVNLASNTSEPADSSNPNWPLFGAIETFSVVFLSFLALGTTAANGFTLFAIYKDPLKCFRTPLTTLITGIIISDFLTGLIVEPILASLYAVKYVHIRLLRTIQVVSLITVNTSFFIILALAIAQFMALKVPVVYERWFTNRSAKIIVAGIWVYSFIFSMLPEIFKMPIWLFYTMDLIMNTTLVTIALIVIYALTYVVFKRQARQLGGNNGENPPQADQPRVQIENDFLKGTFLLTVILIITVWPFMITLYIWIFNPYVNMAKLLQEYMALLICEDILFLKFLWDPLLFIIRVAKYRKAVVMVFIDVRRKCGCGCVQGGAGVVVYNRYANEETVMDDRNEETVVVEDVKYNATEEKV